MYQVIAPALFQHKICRLPGIGTLKMIIHPSQTLFVDSLIQAPMESIVFIPEQTGPRIFNEFSAIAELMKIQLDRGEHVALKGIGAFNKGLNGISFESVIINPLFFPPANAERVIRENEEHAILVGDQETTNIQMAGYYTDKPEKKSRWKLWALIVTLIAIAAIIFYLYKYGFNGFGNIMGL